VLGSILSLLDTLAICSTSSSLSSMVCDMYRGIKY
jgi:hypothetical protein